MTQMLETEGQELEKAYSDFHQEIFPLNGDGSQPDLEFAFLTKWRLL